MVSASSSSQVAALHNKRPRMIESLPKDVLERCFSFLDAQDLCCRVEHVCKSFREVSRSSRLVWEGIASKKYGAEILEAAVSQNGGYGCNSNNHTCNYKHMVADDMRLVATPVISKESCPIWVSWKYNSDTRHYVCLLYCLQYHRPTNEIRIFFEARGETDLRHPGTCSVTRWMAERREPTWPPELKVQTMKTKGFQGVSYGRGHYKGFVSFDASFFERVGTFEFCYADLRMATNRHIVPDYHSASILKTEEPGGKRGLENFFAATNTGENYDFKYTLHDWSPFANDGETDDSIEATELERFRPFVDHEVWVRHTAGGMRRKWWVGRNRDKEIDSDVYSSFVDSLTLIDLARREQARREEEAYLDNDMETLLAATAGVGDY